MLASEVNKKLNKLIARFCTKVRCCLGICSSGSPSLVLNQQGDWINPAEGTAWTLDGNAGTDPNVNFLGTTDSSPLVFRFNSQISGYLSDNNIFFGSSVFDPLTTTAVGITSIGVFTGGGGTGSDESTYVGYQAGGGADNCPRSVFIGTQAGFDNNDAADSVFIGYQACGDGATHRVFQSVLIGASSHTVTDNSNICAVGYDADASGNNSTAIGSQTIVHNQNSIALGYGATSSNDFEFAIPDDVTNIKWRGVSYMLPDTLPSVNSFLKCDSLGKLTWEPI